MPNTLIGTLFQEARLKKNLSLFQLAADVGVSTQTVLNLERKGTCALRIALRIAEHLGIDSIPVR